MLRLVSTLYQKTLILSTQKTHRKTKIFRPCPNCQLGWPLFYFRFFCQSPRDAPNSFPVVGCAIAQCAFNPWTFTRPPCGGPGPPNRDRTHPKWSFTLGAATALWITRQGFRRRGDRPVAPTFGSRLTTPPTQQESNSPELEPYAECGEAARQKAADKPWSAVA